MTVKRSGGSSPRRPPQKLKQLIDTTMARALSHELRSHILFTLGDRIASPSEIARETGAKLYDVDYHFKSLCKQGLIRLVRTEQRRGATQHFYELSRQVVYLDDSAWRRIPESIQSSLSASLLRGVMDEAAAALRAGTFNARDSHQSRTAMILDERALGEVTEIMAKALEDVLEARKACSGRLEKEPGAGIPIELFMVCFETAAGAATAPAEEGA